MARRRTEERRAGLASRGMVRRLGLFSSRVRPRVSLIAIGGLIGATSGAAVDVCRDAPTGAWRAERAADGSLVYVSRVLSVSPSVRRITAQRVARFGPYNIRNCLPPKELRREIQ